MDSDKNINKVPQFCNLDIIEKHTFGRPSFATNFHTSVRNYKNGLHLILKEVLLLVNQHTYLI